MLFLIILTIAACLVSWICVEIAFNEITECNHTFAEYRSYKKRVCVDCGLQEISNGY